jgi:hypothetical protein
VRNCWTPKYGHVFVTAGYVILLATASSASARSLSLSVVVMDRDSRQPVTHGSERGSH